MIDLDLQINSYPIKLGIALDSDLIESARLKKVGFFVRLLSKTQKGENQYWAKNCTITCFGLEFIMIPSRFKETSDSIMIPKMIPTIGKNIKEGKGFKKSDLIFGTSAFLWFEDKVLDRITFQCVHNKYVAKHTLEEFRQVCQQHHGLPEKQLNGLLAIWKNGNSQVISELSMSGNNSYTHWIMKQND
jgi:hypothetical protein